MVPGARTVCKSESGKNNDKKKRRYTSSIEGPDYAHVRPACTAANAHTDQYTYVYCRSLLAAVQ